MSETDEPRTEQAVEEKADAEEQEEGGWPSWLSWGLVIAAAVFGGFLLGSQGGSKGSAGASADSMAIKQQVALMREEMNRAKELATRRFDQYMHSFCREMIRIGLFRDGLDKRLSDLKDDLGKAVDELGKKEGKPEDRIAKAGEDLKKIQDHLAKVAAFYSRETLAMDKVGRIGTMDQHIAYFYLVRLEDLMVKAKAGDERALKEARSCRENIGQFDPKLASDLLKKYPSLAPPAPSQTATAPAAAREE